MSRDLIEAFEGPSGRAEVFEVVDETPGRTGVEKVEYEVVFKGERRLEQTMGGASVLACELSGDPRFLGRSGSS